jgi:DNA polymerase-3 subunit alpha
MALVTKDSYDVHGITQDMVEGGVEFKDVFSEFITDVSCAKYIIGHNVQFDINITIRNLERHNFANTDLFCDKIIECTANLGKQFYNESNRLKLSELYHRLFGEDMVNAHDALVDTISCAKCWFTMKRMCDYKMSVDLCKSEADEIKMRLASVYERSLCLSKKIDI